MRTTTVLALAFLASSLLVSAQESDEANAVLQTERDLAMAYQTGAANTIAQGVMEDYTLTSSTGKVTTRSDDIAQAKKNDPKYEIFENYHMQARVHGDAAVVTGKTHTKGIAGDKTFRFAVPVHGYIRERRRTVALACQPCFKAAGERKVNSALDVSAACSIRSDRKEALALCA